MFHINKKGMPAKCKSKEGSCKLGGPEEHFSSLEQAQEQADILLEREFDLTPNVHFADTSKPSQEIMDTLSIKFSELYVVAEYLTNNNVKPVVCLGKNSDNKNVYHCVYNDDQLFYDITGLVAIHIEDLEEELKQRYNIINDWICVDTQESIALIESLIKINIRSKDSRKDFLSFLENKLSNIQSSDNIKDIDAIEFLIQRLE